MFFTFPKIYPILDSSVIPSVGRSEFLKKLGSSLTDAGVTLLEYRNKTGAEQELLFDAAILRTAMPHGNVKLILDDRAHLVEQIGFDGVHVDTGDATPAEARALLGPERIIGTFAGSEAITPGILSQPADYFAVGPAYATTTKQVTHAPIGPDGVRKLRAEAGPNFVLSVAGGITLERAQLILEAGANMVAVSAAIFRQADPAAEFRRWMAELG